MSTTLTWINPDGSVDVLDLDIYEQESHDMPCDVSVSPVEQGVDVTDNVRRLPKTLTLSGYVSDNPLPMSDSMRDDDKASLGSAAQQNSTGLDLPNAPKYALKSVPLDVPDSPVLLNASALVTAGFGAIASALGLKSPPTANVMQRTTDQAVSQSATVWSYTSWTSHVQTCFDKLSKARDNASLMQVVTDYHSYANMVLTSAKITRSGAEDSEGATFDLTLQEIEIVQAQSVDAPKPEKPAGQPRKDTGTKTTQDDEHKAVKASIAEATFKGLKAWIGS